MARILRAGIQHEVTRNWRTAKLLLQARWTNHDHDFLRQLCAAGAPVPYPVSFADDRLLMQFLGDERAGAAPTLARLRPRGVLLRRVHSVPVPGCVDGWFELHGRFGKLPMSDVLAPAIAVSNSASSTPPRASLAVYARPPIA